MTSWLESYIDLLENLTADRLQELRSLTAVRVEFRDPFNLCHGQDQFIAVMADMFDRLESVQFQVESSLSEGQSAMICWRFSARSAATGAFSFTGMSRIEADSEGLIRLHRDYWDSADLLQKVPLLGGVLRYVKRRAGHG